MSIYPIRGGSAMWALQEGIFKLLQASPELNALVKGIYDSQAPEGKLELPHIIIGEWTEVPYDRLTTTGNDVTVTIHAYSSYQGSREIKLITNALTLLLHQRSFPMEGFALNNGRIDFHNTLNEGDGMQHGIFRFRFRVQPTI